MTKSQAAKSQTDLVGLEMKEAMMMIDYIPSPKD
jgi:hypothetical protein